MKRYNPQQIESKWQSYWDENQTYKADLTSDKPKYIAMSMFNYPSGAGIHIGHAMNYTISDVLARFKRQQGYESYHPVGWDAFGLPAENYAIKSGVSPQESMKTIIPNYHKQYKAMGWSNDWSKEIATHEPKYYKWTQWIFSEMHRAGLAYQDSRMQWWCTKCQTVLANEQVIDGKCWRHDAADDPIVEQKEVKQWFFKITDYADELLDATDELDWTDSVKLAQKNWIGRSKGAEIDFAIDGRKDKLTVFTTRPDTLYGVTFMVLAPEHPLVGIITTDQQKDDIARYVKQAALRTEVERQSNDRDKTGVFTGAYAVNPINNEKIPVWIADYVLMGYGTGAIMAVPAHDERDHTFARHYNLPIREVIAAEYGTPAENETWVDGSTIVVYDKSSGKYLGLDWGKGFIGLVSGGVDNGEDYQQAAVRELAEEAGITNAEVRPFGSMVYTHYYHMAKKLNRFAGVHPFLAIVDSQDIADGKREAHEKFTPKWYDADHMIATMKKFNGTDHWVKYLQQAKQVVAAMEKGEDDPIFTDLVHEGVMVNSGEFDGTNSFEMRDKIVAELVKKGVGKEHVNYRMRDWSVSRQRYWGAPIPIVHCPDHGAVLVPDADLPVVLPEITDYAPSGDGRSALARATEWVKAPCPICGKMGERETDTLDTYICSSWYMLRYYNPHDDKHAFETDTVNKWMPIDFYNGADHATAHMLYARFVTRFFNKKGLVNTPEPFKKFLFNGKITAHDGQMFSKSKGNGIDPLEIINDGYGADALRTYLMFASPLEIWTRWDPQGVPGAYRFLTRLWTLVHEYTADTTKDGKANKDLARAVHRTIKKVTEDVEAQRYNTAIAAMMECVNDLYKVKAAEGYADRDGWKAALQSMVQLVAPFAPHIAEELWHDLGHKDSVHVDHWPTWDEAMLQQDTMNIVVQVNGRVRATLQMPKDADEKTVTDAALADEHVKQFVSGVPKRTIYIAGKILNIVA